MNDIPEGHVLWTPPSVDKYSAWKDSLCGNLSRVENSEDDTSVDDTVLKCNATVEHTSDEEEDRKMKSFGDLRKGSDTNSKLVYKASTSAHLRRASSLEPVPAKLDSGPKVQSVSDFHLDPGSGSDGDAEVVATVVDMPPQKVIAPIPKRKHQLENAVSSSSTSATIEPTAMLSSPLRSSSSHNIAKPDKPNASKKRKTTRVPPKATKRAKKNTVEDSSTSEATGQDPVFGPRNIFLPVICGKTLKYPCPYKNCAQECKFPGDLRRHLKCRDHSRPSEICPKCGAAYTREDALKRHNKKKPDCDVPPST